MSNVGGVVTSTPAMIALSPSLPAALVRYQTAVSNETSLISYYTLDAGDARDARNTHPGTVANVVAFSAGPGGVTNQSLTLDGTGHIDLELGLRLPQGRLRHQQLF